ncbi:MAG TPA: hypothetical protein VGN76_08200 [Gemmatimonadales bacterium]|nr:hypothetical protein [Gemmatimonadales bacterium]
MRPYLALGSLAAIVLTGAVPNAKGPSIQGTYKLVSRDLSDGTKQVPPDVVGLITYTAKYRNFNVYWKDAKGKAVSISNIATYQLTPKEYRETSVYYLMNDESGGKGLSYDLSASTGSSPVVVKGTRIEMQLPLHNEPKVVFQGNSFTATREGVFVDHWVRVP